MPLVRRLTCLFAVWFAFAGIALAEPPKPPMPLAPPAAEVEPQAQGLGQYLRFVDQGAAGGRLETADVVFVNDAGAVVRLVSAVHIGEADYFKSIQRDLTERQAVLYELIKPRGVDAPRPGEGGAGGGAIGQLQRFLKDTLTLEFQLDHMDYTAPNFIHADLDAETFQQKQAERGESFATIMLQQMMRAMSQPPVPADPQDIDKAMEELVMMITRPDMERRLKIFIAKRIGEMEEHALGLDGPGGSVILTERNIAAMNVLKNVLDDGKKDVAIFYGAAHMPDFAVRLQDMGFKPVATEWRLAWDLSIRHDQPSAIEKILMDLLRGMD